MPGRIPIDIAGAVAYAVRTDNYLQLVPAPPTPTHGTRLGLTGTNVSDWHAKRQAIEACFLKWSDDSQKTKPVNRLMARLAKEFREFAQPLLDGIAASTSLNTTDETVFNVVGDTHHHGPTHRATPIVEQCFPRMVTIGGGEMAEHVRTNNSSAKDHIFEEADGFEVAYSITDTPTVLTDPDNAKSKFFTRASVILALGAPNKGKYINHRERWVFLPNADFDGPWSASQSDLIE